MMDLIGQVPVTQLKDVGPMGSQPSTPVSGVNEANAARGRGPDGVRLVSGHELDAGGRDRYRSLLACHRR